MGRYNHKDSGFLNAKADGYRSRASYKLIELDKKCALLKGKGLRVCDFGSAPGGWLQVVEAKLGPKGRAVGVDIVGVEPFKSDSILTLVGDISDSGLQQQVVDHLGGRADLVLSDMSEKLTGIYFRDVCRSADLMNLALGCAEKILANGGSFVAKYFPGEETEEVVRELRKKFKNVKSHSLKSTRKSSKEKYVVAKNYIGSQ